MSKVWERAMALRMGVVGTGKIARKHARAMSLTGTMTLKAVASRTHAAARAFTDEHGGDALEGWRSLLTRDDIDALYIATPTGAKHEVAMAALEAGKHVLVEKPLANSHSARALADKAREMGLALMDATHFTHNPRTELLLAAILDGAIGTPISMMVGFHADVGGPENIRFDPVLEPYGVLGDLGWYCARLVVDLVPEAVERSKCHVFGTFRDGALVACTGVAEFPSDSFRLAFDCSFTAGAFAQDMTLTGTGGIISMDDFVHDWARARIGEEKPQFPAGYRLRRGRCDPGSVTFVPTPSEKSHMVGMLEAFAGCAAAPLGDRAAGARRKLVHTQEILDAVWDAIPRSHD